MLRCTMDMSIPKESKCAYCCVYCLQKDCTSRCELPRRYENKEKTIYKSCTICYEEDSYEDHT